MRRKLQAKVALVTGGSRGIGVVNARALADDGADVAISYLASPDKADQAWPEVEGLVNAVAGDFGRLDLGPRGITVNAVQPGSIDTDVNPKGGGDFAEARRKEHALQRLGRSEEVAAGVVTLASPEASFVTGTVLNIGSEFGT